MASRKLSPSLVPEKATILFTNASTQYLHFISGVQTRNEFVLVCESQPLTTYRSYGPPNRCPACGARNSFKVAERSNSRLRGVLGDPLDAGEE